MHLKQADFLDPRSKRLIGKYLAGGVAAGSSAALATSLINYYHMLQEEAKELNDTSADDDVLYLNLPSEGNPTNAPKVSKGTGQSQAEKNASIGGGLAITGGALAALGSYAAVRKLYQKYKKKRVQEQLDDAQQGFFDTVSQEAAAEKRAAQGKPMGGVEFATSMPVTLTLLAAIASGALTNRALDKTFPRVKKPTNPAPKKIVLRKQPSYYETEEEDDDTEKVATAQDMSYDSRSDDDVYNDGLELAIHMCLGQEKAASEGDLHTIVGAVLDGRKHEIVSNIMGYGFDAAMDMSKGAGLLVKEATPHDIAVAVGTCVHTPELKPIMGVLAASEYSEMAPHFYKAGASQSEGVKDVLCKIAGVLGALGRAMIFENAEVTLAKQANEDDAPLDVEQVLELIDMIREGREGSVKGPGAGGNGMGGTARSELDNPEESQTLLSTDSESSEEVAGDQDGGSRTISVGGSDQGDKPRIVRGNPVTVEADPKDEIDNMLAGDAQLA